MKQPAMNVAPSERAGAGHSRHGWMMMACCIPVLVIAITAVATGLVGAGLIFGAIMCVVMMAVMMRMMSGGGQK
jgi:hypothetical protein